MVYGYDEAGNKTGETLPNGIVLTYGYVSLNRHTSLTEVQGGTTLFSQGFILKCPFRERHVSEE